MPDPCADDPVEENDRNNVRNAPPLIQIGTFTEAS